MKLYRNITCFALAALVAAAAAAGGDKKCDVDTNTCIRMMVDQLSHRGWIGIEWDDQAEIPVLTLVVEGSPAQKAGLRRGDLLRAFNGVDTSLGPEAVWAEAKKSLVPGKTITLTIERSGARKDLDVLLVAVPREVMAQWIGNHVLDHHLAEAAKADEADKEKAEAETPSP